MEKAACVEKEAWCWCWCLTVLPTLTAPEKEPETREKCYKKRWGRRRRSWRAPRTTSTSSRRCQRRSTVIYLKNYFSQKCSSVFGKQKVEPIVKDDETPEVAKPAAVESR
ncbi:hypothetical protein GQ55_9G104000 [Panicum hallii var. hallii]|uniref:Uncharacterized protein n=1 Tax=Panicum hallii var. hallii TaxID=1504633 RepID=A0A2T7C1P3_9POAL|nr:hypothetical protein GQ55_9G104000 [Panicum hallii var. hallii]